MLYTPIAPPPRVTARYRPDTPVHLAEWRRERLARLLAQFERDDIEAAVDGLIAMLDARDGDADVEANGDERDGSWSHEETAGIPASHGEGGPGCAISDPGEPIGDESDAAWLERLDQGKRSLPRIPRHAYEETSWRGLAIGSIEDIEDDGDAADGNGAEDDFAQHRADGPGCPVADADGASWPDWLKQPGYDARHLHPFTEQAGRSPTRNAGRGGTPDQPKRHTGGT